MVVKRGGQTKNSRTRVRLGQGGTVKKLVVSAAMVLGLAGAANAADMPIPTKAWTPPAASDACAGLTDFLLSSCRLSWYGVTFYGTVDMGGTYQTHGSPFDPNFPTGASYLLGAGGGNATNRSAGFGLGPNGMSQSNVGVKVIEPIAPGGWSFISQNEFAFDPYSLLLANAPQAMQNGIGVAENLQAQPYELEPVGVAGGDECRRLQPAGFWHDDLRPAELAAERLGRRLRSVWRLVCLRDDRLFRQVCRRRRHGRGALDHGDQVSRQCRRLPVCRYGAAGQRRQ